MSSKTAQLLKLTVAAGNATPSPPVGPALGQKGIRAIDFCKQFNEESVKRYIKGTPLRCRILAKPDRTFSFTISPPTTSWMILQATNSKASGANGKHSAAIDARYIYEMARIKQSLDPHLKHVSLVGIVKSTISSAKSMGIRVIHPEKFIAPNTSET